MMLSSSSWSWLPWLLSWLSCKAPEISWHDNYHCKIAALSANVRQHCRLSVCFVLLEFDNQKQKNKKDSDCDWSGLKIHKGKSHKLQSTTPVTTSAPVVASSSSITTSVSISSPVTSPTPLTEPVFGPSIPFIFSTTQIFRQTELPLKCDKCQFSCDPLIVMQNHRKEKHRLWECRRCGDSYTNLLTNMIVVPENVVSIHMWPLIFHMWPDYV